MHRNSLTGKKIYLCKWNDKMMKFTVWNSSPTHRWVSWWKELTVFVYNFLLCHFCPVKITRRRWLYLLADMETDSWRWFLLNFFKSAARSACVLYTLYTCKCKFIKNKQAHRHLHRCSQSLSKDDMCHVTQGFEFPFWTYFQKFEGMTLGFPGYHKFWVI